MKKLEEEVRTDAYATWAGIVGKFGLGTTNEGGKTLLEFAKTYSLTLANREEKF